MTGRGDLRERVALLAELRQIVQAMKNLAFAELQRGARVLSAAEMARDTVLHALDEVRAMQAATLTDAPKTEQPASWVVIGAERGFCGAFNSRLAAQAAQLRRPDRRTHLLVAGRRLADLLADDAVVALPGCEAIDDVRPVLDAWLAALAPEARDGRELWLLHTGASGWSRERLLPRPSPPRDAPRSVAPLRYLAPAVLEAALQTQAVRLVLQTALHESMQQENRWRLAQMQRAQDHLDEIGRTLRRRNAVLRQADITNELETLMSSLQGAIPAAGLSSATP